MTVLPATDFLVIGSGIAGLRAAVELAPAGRVRVLTKAEPAAGSTGYAQGGIAAALGPDDSADLHARDTLAASAGLCDRRAVDALVADGPARVAELLDWGAAFDRRPDGTLDLAREGAHSVRRVLHARDATGREIGRVLASRVVGRPELDVVDHATVVQLAVAGGRVTGARFLDAHGRLHEAPARATLLATGGAGQLFADTTNPPVAAGDGMALGWLAGARVVDLEFVQFHPTALAIDGVPRYLLSEALRGEGARLINAAGEPFMRRYDPAGDLASRDRVSRAILDEVERTGADVFLSLAHLPAGVVRERFPLIASLCRKAGLDVATDRLPVRPAAHYVMGGLDTDLDGRTSLPGLFAAGEVACTGVHGANRLASNSLLEGLVFGARAGRAMALSPEAVHASRTSAHAQPPPVGENSGGWPIDEAALQALMSRAAGVFRQRAALEAAVARLDEAWQAVAAAEADGQALDGPRWRLASLIVVGRLVARAALRRQETRGAHARSDFPERDDLHWNRREYDTR